MALPYYATPVPLTAVWLDVTDWTVVAVCDSCGKQAGAFVNDTAEDGSESWAWAREHWRAVHDGKPHAWSKCALREFGCMSWAKQSGLCPRHWAMKRDHGVEHWRTQPIHRAAGKDAASTCTETSEPCDRPIAARGLCSKHYQRLKRDGLSPLPEAATECAAPQCDRKRYAKGLCTKHYERMRSHGTLDLPPKPPRPTCDADGCDDRRWRLGRCRRHYHQVAA